ncbi:MAG: hypothetical protein HYY65_03035 [Candidatus Tectomicrobia bacterium]|uniref:Magnesium transporter MgtE intracellular domain-containing protein n=1 Tax=Tectimicrobiota bacterium TaxID=2528274 RepID=A0A932GNF2_UNCTE|nr:hypothetical protein [Candidatus Tectomicrobia bacterium]
MNNGGANPDPKKLSPSKRAIGPQVLSPGRLLRAALRHPDEGPTFARLSGGIPGTTRGPALPGKTFEFRITANFCGDYLRRGAGVILCLGWILVVPLLGFAADSTEGARSASAQGAPLSLKDLQILQSLEKRKEDLDRREEALKRYEERLQSLKQEVEKKLAEILQTEKRIQERLGMIGQMEEEKISRLAKLYSGMRPEEAAPLLERMQEETTLKVFQRMKDRQASRILAFMNPEKAARLSEQLAKPPGR